MIQLLLVFPDFRLCQLLNARKKIRVHAFDVSEQFCHRPFEVTPLVVAPMIAEFLHGERRGTEFTLLDRAPRQVLPCPVDAPGSGGYAVQHHVDRRDGLRSVPLGLHALRSRQTAVRFGRDLRWVQPLTEKVRNEPISGSL
jgi:hypothetical protein